MFRLISAAFLSLILNSNLAIAAEPAIPQRQLETALALARVDAQNLAATGTVCEGEGLGDQMRGTMCGVKDFRQDGAIKFVTTRCFHLCKNGYFEVGNFCSWPLKDDLKISDGHCDR